MNTTDRTWTGYLRADGHKGTRNLVLVIYTVECAQFVAHAVAQGEASAQVIGFPGCYDNAYAVRLLLALARHPNVGGVLTVGLGCEYTQPARIAAAVRASGRPAQWFTIQDTGGTAESIARGKELIADLSHEVEREARRTPMTLADLTAGGECGGSDATSGLAGNPSAGAFFDRLVDAGGTAVIEETVEMVGLLPLLLERAANARAREQLTAAYAKMEAYARSVRQHSIAPGNFAGGLTTIEEKSMGAFVKSGSRSIQGVIRVAERPPHPGLWIMDTVPDAHFLQFGYTNPNDSEGIMDLLSCGAQVNLFITGRGSIIGGPIAPLIKVTGNPQTYRRMAGDMDFDASRVLSGEITLDEAGDELSHLVVEVAGGRPSKSEAIGHREYFIMYKYQDAPQRTAGCQDKR